MSMQTTALPSSRQHPPHGSHSGIAMILEVSAKEAPRPLAPRLPSHHYAPVLQPNPAGAIMPPMSASSALNQARTSTSGAAVDGIRGPPAGSGRRKRKPAATDALSSSETGGKGWTKELDHKLRAAVAADGPRNWKSISEDVFGGLFTDTQCLNRWYKVLRPGLVKGPWTKEEDDIIFQCMSSGVTKWSEIADRIPGRLGKQCRERWLNHLDPSLKKGEWTKEEDTVLLQAQARWGNSWTRIAELLPGRSENAVKNRWNSASHTRTRCARVVSSSSSPPDEPPLQTASSSSSGNGGMVEWGEAHEMHVVRDYCAGFQDGDTLSDFVPFVMARLQAARPADYDQLDCNGLSLLHQRLRSALEEVTLGFPQDSPIHRVVFRKRGRPTNVSSSAGEVMQAGRPPAAAAMGKPRGSMGSGNHKGVDRRRPEDMEVDSGSSQHTGVVVAAEEEVVSMAVSSRHSSEKRPVVERPTAAAGLLVSGRGRTSLEPEPYRSVYYEPPREEEEEEEEEEDLEEDLEEEDLEEEEEADGRSVSSLSSMSTMTEADEDGKARRTGRKAKPHHSGAHKKARSGTAAEARDKQRGSSGGGQAGLKSSKGTAQHKHPRGQQQQQAEASAASAACSSVNKSRLRDVISLLFSAMRKETDASKRALCQDTLDAATQELPAIVNYVEGVLGSSSSTLDLGDDADRAFLLDSLLKATERGVFR